MWTVAWELYHDFPTLRRMLLGAQGPAREKRSQSQSPRGKDSAEDLTKEVPRLPVMASTEPRRARR